MPREKAISDEEFDEIDSYVKRERPRALTKEERLDILRLHAHFRRLNVDSPTEHIASIIGRSRKVVREVWQQYRDSKSLVVKQTPANNLTHTTRVPRTKEVLRKVVEFVREKRRTRTRVVAKDVMMMLVEGGHISYNESDCKDTAACLRSVQDYLFSRGFKRGHKKGQGQYGLTKEVVVARDKYIKCMSRSIELTPHRPVVYLDESYIHHNYARHNDSLYFPDDADDKAPKPKHKGQRLCFIAAIVDDGPTRSKLMTKRVFRGGRRETKDYHGMFDRAYFVNWFKELLDELDLLGKEGALIVMDNASYHKTLPPDTPKGTWKKQDLLAACERFGIDASTSDFKTVVWSKVQAYIKENVVPEVVVMAQARGHEVAYTPPYHSNLQPIEYVWAYVKGIVGRQYTTETSMADVAARLDLTFADVSGGLIHRCIDRTKKKVREMNSYLVELEATDEAANEPPLPVDEESSDDDECDDDESILTDIVDVNLV